MPQRGGIPCETGKNGRSRLESEDLLLGETLANNPKLTDLAKMSGVSFRKQRKTAIFGRVVEGTRQVGARDHEE